MHLVPDKERQLREAIHRAAREAFRKDLNGHVCIKKGGLCGPSLTDTSCSLVRKPLRDRRGLPF